jgi:hypothetical protein
MKRILNIILITLLSFSVSAQIDEGDKRFSFVGGLNISYLNGDDGEDIVEDLDDYIDAYDDQSGVDAEGGIKPRIGMHLGFGYDYFVADNIAINTGLIYSMKGFVQKMEIKSDGSSQFVYTGNVNDGFYSGYGYGYFINGGSSKVESKLSINLNYFDIPIGVKYATDDGFELFGGIVVSLLASDNIDSDWSSSPTQSDPYDDIDDFEDFFDEDPEGTVVGFQCGVGYTFNEKFNISFKLQQGGELGEINDEDENKNLTLQLSTGLYF